MANCRLLHGILHATIFQASQIVNEHRIHGRIPHFLRKICLCCGGPFFMEKLEECTHIGKGHSKLYASIDIGIARVAKTRIIENEPSNPEWNETFHAFCAYEAEAISITLKDNLPIGSQVVGKAHIPIHQVLAGDVVEGGFDLFSEHKQGAIRGKIYVKLHFLDIKKDDLWNSGIPSPSFPGITYAFFRQRKENRIRLYQDSHVANEFLPLIHLKGNKIYKPERCWEDIYKAIEGALHLVYIAGWSVYTKITLVRDSHRMLPGAAGVTLGELLKKKAEEGVRVLLLIWDDKTSSHVLKNNGLMHTHDEDTEAYFRGTKVHCVLCPRNPDDASSFVQGLEVGLIFTHHQKIVVVDVPLEEDMGSGKRTLISFVGGIDLCDGRYDTQAHSLFRTLNTVHKYDFHQPNFEGTSLMRGGPRVPWHDIHSRLEGPVAWDVLYNFEQRWKRQGIQGLLLPVREIKDIVPASASGVLKEEDSETWHSQVFRSIDEGAVVGFSKDPDVASAIGLMSGKERVYERSVQDGYISAIRRAKNFIYMENQYFIGSSASWSSSQNMDALQLIPIEITLKIISKIEAGERFPVYIVLPMWPEGVPESSSVQAILHWQRWTMEMMYKRISHALKTKGLHDVSATDYLDFFCLGNRERMLPGEWEPPEAPQHGTDYWMAQQNRRFMIYVHAKMMIVDDEYIIVGSANCNQRSMDGTRDSEIAHGSFQPHHLMVSDRPPRGQIHGFRMALWFEHTGKLEDDYLNPESLNCVRKIKKRAEELWDLYIGEEVVDLPGHLLPYPMSVVDEDDEGQTNLRGFPFLPDTKAPIRGTNAVLPPLLTT